MNRPNIQNYEIASGDTYSTKYNMEKWKKDFYNQVLREARYKKERLLKVKRPSKRDYMKIGDTTTPYIFYQDRYMDALDIYCDYLEKALDKSCVQLTQCRDCYFDCPFKDKCEDLCEYESKWKEWLLNDS